MNLNNIINKISRKYFIKKPIQKCLNRQIYENNDNVKRYMDLQKSYMHTYSNSHEIKKYWEDYYNFINNY